MRTLPTHHGRPTPRAVLWTERDDAPAAYTLRHTYTVGHVRLSVVSTFTADRPTGHWYRTVRVCLLGHVHEVPTLVTTAQAIAVLRYWRAGGSIEVH